MLDLGFGFCEGFAIFAQVLARVILNSFKWKQTSSPKKIVRQTLAQPMFMFGGTFCPALFSDIGLLILRESIHI